MVTRFVDSSAELERMSNKRRSLLDLEGALLMYIAGVTRELDETYDVLSPDDELGPLRKTLHERLRMAENRLEDTRDRLQYLNDRLGVLEGSGPLDFATIGGFASLAFPGPVTLKLSGESI
jgi:hypothetical protein